MINFLNSLAESAKSGSPGVLLRNFKISGQLVDNLSIRSVPSPPKVLVHHYRPGSKSFVQFHRVLTWSDNVTGLVGQVGAVALIQRSSGARIGEVLRLTVLDIANDDTLLIWGLKRSRSRSVRIPELSPQFVSFDKSTNHLLFTISYAHVYRQYIHAGIIIQRFGRFRNSVTHTYRHNFINTIQKASHNVTATAEVIGHKSKTSTEKYLTKGQHHG